VAECPAIPGCISQGATEQAAIENIQEAIAECIAFRREMGLRPYETYLMVKVIV